MKRNTGKHELEKLGGLTFNQILNPSFGTKGCVSASVAAFQAEQGDRTILFSDAAMPKIVEIKNGKVK